MVKIVVDCFSSLNGAEVKFLVCAQYYPSTVALQWSFSWTLEDLFTQKMSKQNEHMGALFQDKLKKRQNYSIIDIYFSKEGDLKWVI